MTASLVFTANDNFTDTTLPKLYRDYLINAGSKYLFDFGDVYCNPNVVNGVSAVANATQFVNLVDGAPVATNAGSTTTQAADGGMVFAGTSNGATYINLGNTYDLSAANPEFLVIAWSKAATNCGNDRTAVMLGSGNAAFQYSIESSNAGANFNGGLVNDGTATQWAYHRHPNGTTKRYKNGVLMSTTTGNPTTLADYSASITRIGYDPGATAFNGTVYRVYLENLTVSGESALAQVQRDYAANAGRFT